MAGKDASQAIETYRADLRQAFKCLDVHTRVEFQAPDRGLGAMCSWIVAGSGRAEGIELPGGQGYVLEASQSLQIVACDPERYGGPVRLSTRRYDYSVSEPRVGEIWAMHWHPGTDQQIDYPHMHIRRLFERTHHLATSRLLVEHAIHWAIEGGAKSRYEREEWQSKLQATVLRHIGSSEWSVDPGAKA
ncbi:hypothetical protein [Mycobacteroides salmoniphilum]|uniref:Uncharacterized protein n=1 Tax=Mycobacteroides salmoniphilum TaxID=404941 RepID=A0A4R8SW87_9MYCO|nr:hypothetical protein [Mycobacteroides salmoniphilum]TEA06285.1 hypothetical protein CCUG60884_01423 [Mycobacteroides salmoniphilum]